MNLCKSSVLAPWIVVVRITFSAQIELCHHFLQVSSFAAVGEKSEDGRTHNNQWGIATNCAIVMNKKKKYDREKGGER